MTIWKRGPDPLFQSLVHTLSLVPCGIMLKRELSFWFYKRTDKSPQFTSERRSGVIPEVSPYFILNYFVFVSVQPVIVLSPNHSSPSVSSITLCDFILG